MSKYRILLGLLLTFAYAAAEEAGNVAGRQIVESIFRHGESGPSTSGQVPTQQA